MFRGRELRAQGVPWDGCPFTKVRLLYRGLLQSWNKTQIGISGVELVGGGGGGGEGWGIAVNVSEMIVRLCFLSGWFYEGFVLIRPLSGYAYRLCLCEVGLPTVYGVRILVQSTVSISVGVQ